MNLAAAQLRDKGLLTAIYVVALALTRPHYLGDTMIYAADIGAYWTGRPETATNPLWEFGHLLWRPLGYLLYAVFGPIIPDSLGLDRNLEISLCLIAFTVLCGWIAVLALHSVAQRISGSRLLAFAAACVLLFSNAFLNFTQTGSSYIPGLMLLMLAFAWLVTADNQAGRRAAVLSGVVAAFAALFWFPYILVLPALILASPLGRPGEQPASSRSSTIIAIAAICTLFVGYGVAIFAQGFSNTDAVVAWFQQASHGRVPSAINAPRAVLGFARSFVYFGDTGLTFKRLLLSDPYAPSSWSGSTVLALLAIALFYAALLGLSLTLARSALGRRWLLLLSAAALPLFAFAVFLFEAGDAERYLPLFPFLFGAVAAAFVSAGRGPRVILAAISIAIVGSTTLTMSLPASDARDLPVITRLEPIRPRLRAQDALVLLNYQDPVMLFSMTRPFHSLNRPPFRNFDIVEAGTTRVDTWRQEFATRVLRIWSGGGDVWLTNRVFAEQPLPEWRWAEGVDPRLSWKQLPEFFRNFEVGESIGAPDGFVLLVPSEKNRRTLEQTGTLPNYRWP